MMIKNNKMGTVRSTLVSKIWKTMRMKRKMTTMRYWRRMMANLMILLMSLGLCWEKSYWLMTSWYKTIKMWIRLNSLWINIWEIGSGNLKMLITLRVILGGRVLIKDLMGDRRSDRSLLSNHRRPLGCSIRSHSSIVQIKLEIRAPLEISKWWHHSSNSLEVGTRSWIEIQTKMTCKDCRLSCSPGLRFLGHLRVVRDHRDDSKIFLSNKR